MIPVHMKIYLAKQLHSYAQTDRPWGRDKMLEKAEEDRLRGIYTDFLLCIISSMSESMKVNVQECFKRWASFI